MANAKTSTSKQRKTRKFAQVKRMMSPNDSRLKENQMKTQKKEEEKKKALVKRAEAAPTSLFFSHNEALVPPYRVLVDTNFINLSLENRIDITKGMMDVLYAQCTPVISDCVIAELEKLGEKYRLALRVARDPRFERIPCTHKGTYADDCIVSRVTAQRCYIVATCDRALRRRIRKIPGVPLMYITQKHYAVERLPDQALG